MNGRPYRDPERCVDLHAALMRCYEAVVMLRMARGSDVPDRRLAGHRDALIFLADVQPALRSLLFDEPAFVAPAVSAELQPVLDEARAQAMAARRYLRPEVAEDLHLVLVDCSVLADQVCAANARLPGAERRSAYGRVLDALHALAPRLIALVVKPVGEVSA